MKVPENAYDRLLRDTLPLELHADEDEQVYYAWSAEFPEVPPTRSPKLGRAIEMWLEDWSDFLAPYSVRAEQVQ